MSTTSTAIFNGTSRFTNDFQQVITRSVAIASLPITQLTNVKTALSSQATEVTSIQSKFSSLQTAISNLSNATGLSSLTTSVSDVGIASVSLSSGASPASYSLQVQSLGAFSNSLSSGSLTRVSDPTTQNLSNSQSFSLTVNGTTTSISPASNTLNSLVAALNDTAGLNVQASLVNVGSNSAPDYRLSLQSTKLGSTAIQLNDGSSDLLTTISTGTLATYFVNGLTTPISSDSRVVTLAPGVQTTLVGQSAAGSASTINITRQSSSIGNALSAFVNSYNSVADELQNNRGKSGGALTGNSVIQELSNQLRSLATFSSDGAQISSLASIGITFDGKGHLAYDSSAFSSATTASLPAVLNFLGSATSSGFLKSAADILSSVNDPASGVLTTTGSTLAKQVIAQQDLIDANQARVDQLKTNLQAQLAKSDAQVAALEQSYTVLTGIFQAEQINSQYNK